MRVLLSCYACEPNRGSEPSVGWNWSVHLARHCEVTVVTRENNRDLIERECLKNTDANKIQWRYHDLDDRLMWLKKKFRAHRLYYLLWQNALEKKLLNSQTNEHFDIVHHLTFASYRYSTAIGRLPAIRIWGPVGGAEFTPWHLLPWDAPRTLAAECVRNLQTSGRGHLSQARRYDIILSSTHETQELLSKAGYPSRLMPTIGIEAAALSEAPQRYIHSNGLSLLFIGNLQHLKGIHFVLRALAQIPSAKLTIVGSGSYEIQLRKLTRKLALNDRVIFTGFIPQNELPELHQSHDVFAFPSLHDSGGMALLEAMAAGMPSITLACGGPRVLADESCGFQIPVTNEREIVSSIAKAITHYADSPELRAQHATAAIERVRKHFLWEEKAKAMIRVYHEAMDHFAQRKTTNGH